MRTNISYQAFEQEVLRARELVVVAFWSMTDPLSDKLDVALEDLSDTFDGMLKVVNINVGSNPEAARDCGFSEFPAILFFREGDVVGRFEKPIDPDKVQLRVAQIMALSAAESLAEGRSDY